jgi:hypothetical protein
VIPADTSREAAALQLRMLNALTGSQRLRMVIDMSEFVRRLKLSALRSENPGLSEIELKKLVLKSCFTSTEVLPKVLR